jgi:hypothetical protein
MAFAREARMAGQIAITLALTSAAAIPYANTRQSKLKSSAMGRSVAPKSSERSNARLPIWPKRRPSAAPAAESSTVSANT